MKNATSSKSKRPLHMGLVLTLLVTIALILAAWFLLPKPNYAEEVARPIGQDLIKAGAIKKCETGDNGKGFVNTEPWYQVYFEIPKSEDDTISLVNTVARENGYNLNHASPTDRGPLGVDDKFIDKWYFDNTSKASPYRDLQDGKIDLAVTVNNPGAEESCGKSTPIKLDTGHSVVRISVNLPEFKR